MKGVSRDTGKPVGDEPVTANFNSSSGCMVNRIAESPTVSVRVVHGTAGFRGPVVRLAGQSRGGRSIDADDGVGRARDTSGFADDFAVDAVHSSHSG